MDAVKAVPDSEPDPKKGKKRARSGVRFPYYDLDDAVTVAITIHERAGGACDLDQLASWLDHDSINSGAFRLRMSAAKMFGLVEKAGTGKLRVSKRGIAIIAPVNDSQAAEARKDAFLAIELFQNVYEQFKGMTLPQVAGLRNLAREEYEIVPGRVNDAIRVMLDSAEQAGFFAASGDRTKMVAPVIGRGAPVRAAEVQVQDQHPRTVLKSESPVFYGGGGGDGSGIDPMVLAFVRKMPPAGAALSSKKRQALIDAFTATVDFIYTEESDSERPQTEPVEAEV